MIKSSCARPLTPKGSNQLSGANGLAPEAAQNLLSVERVAFHQQLHQTSNRFLFRSHDRTRALELRIDQLIRRFLNSIEQSSG